MPGCEPRAPRAAQGRDLGNLPHTGAAAENASALVCSLQSPTPRGCFGATIRGHSVGATASVGERLIGTMTSLLDTVPRTCRLPRPDAPREYALPRTLMKAQPSVHQERMPMSPSLAK